MPALFRPASNASSMPACAPSSTCSPVIMKYVASHAEPTPSDKIAVELPEVEPQTSSVPASWREYAFAVLIVGVATLAALLLRPYLAATNLAMVYLLGVVAVATRSNRRASVMASFLSVAAFDFFCVPPYLTLQVSEYEYLITFAGMLVVALVISAQTSRIRAQAVRAEE